MALSEEEEQRLRLQFVKSQRTEAAVAIAFGLIILALAAYLSADGVPFLRQGRLLIAFAVGAGAIFYGAAKWFGFFREW